MRASGNNGNYTLFHRTALLAVVMTVLLVGSVATIIGRTLGIFSLDLRSVAMVAAVGFALLQFITLTRVLLVERGPERLTWVAGILACSVLIVPWYWFRAAQSAKLGEPS